MAENDGYVHKKGLVYKNQYHIIFCPKYRRKVLINGIDERLKEILYDIAEEIDVEIMTLEVMPDHVHMFIEFDPRINLHNVVKRLKGRSSHILREEYPSLKKKLPSLWTRSYFSCTIGHISEETIKQYVESQKNK
ncbi:MAG: IS200/IS605 family transposase [Solobacterium sp.]|nr:IS200/IS605 family transposase [Solobacterium sp.]